MVTVQQALNLVKKQGVMLDAARGPLLRAMRPSYMSFPHRVI